MKLLTQALRTARRNVSYVKNLRFFDQRTLYTYWERSHLRRLLADLEVDCVYDVGAHHGEYVDVLRKSGYRGLVLSFEPQPLAAQVLRRKAAGDAFWHIEELALSDRDGEMPLNIMRGTQFSSLSSPRHDEAPIFRSCNAVREVVTVQTETLATAYRRLQARHGFRRPFLKLDTQGFDVAIVRSAGEVLQQFVGLQSELAVKRLYESSVDFREALTFYQSCGFELSALVPNNAGHFPRLVEADCIMVRRDLVH
ncbi:FkbM family methyltransferase [Aquabacterium sp. A7-Y]|uniref:FkbM family methyltransferase n=1 Tax=Aquabacterium sp. A7-Y TaxID=1349605 RepID=UPI00223D7302|nr:FkbM family methyltransferase [Aquabacterium sp. A7-Y]MCW7540546.1 FkbM family methyltransferase [Aquabacterium sp. A7-Y]